MTELSKINGANEIQGAPEVTSIVETVDVDMARTLLELNRPYSVGTEDTNRRVRQNRVDELTKAILAGEWVCTNQGIGISIEDELVDGQHRLLALLQAAEVNPDITIRSLVVWNLPVEAKNAVDIGGARRPGDFIAMRGVASANNIAAALRLLHCYDEIPYDYQTWIRYHASPAHLMELLKKYGNLQDAYLLGRGAMRVTSPSSMTTAIAIAGRDRPDLDLERFLHPLRTGANLGIGSPILALRTQCANAAKLKKRLNSVTLLGLILRSMNHWVEGNRSQHIVFNEAQPFPRLTTKEFYPR